MVAAIAAEVALGSASAASAATPYTYAPVADSTGPLGTQIA